MSTQQEWERLTCDSFEACDRVGGDGRGIRGGGAGDGCCVIEEDITDGVGERRLLVGADVAGLGELDGHGPQGRRVADAATTQAKTGVKTATDTLTSSIDALGTPSTGDGPKAKTAVNNLVTQLQSLSSSIQQTLASPGSTPVEVAGSLAQVGSDLGKAANEVKSTGTTLKGLKPNGQLQKAFKSSASCQKLKNSI